MKKAKPKGKPKTKEEQAIERMTRSHLHQWAVKHRVGVVVCFMVFQIVAMGEMGFILAREMRRRSLEPFLPPRPKLADWLKLYSSPRDVWKVLGELMSDGEFTGEEMMELIDSERKAFRHLKKYPKATEKKLKAIRPDEWQNTLREAIEVGEGLYQKSLHAALTAEEVQEGEVDTTERDLARPEFHFALAVVLPSIFEYSTTPWHLAEDAKKGDVLAIERLLRLDAEAMQLPFIAEWVHSGVGSIRTGRFAQAADWAKAGPKGRLQRIDYKHACAALISVVAAQWNLVVKDGKLERCPLTARQIRSLFDALAKDRTNDDQAQDRDFAGPGLGNLKKAILRRKPGWRWFIDNAMGVDTKSSK